MNNVVELQGDAMEQLRRGIDRVVKEGAVFATVVITYPGGQQIILKPTDLEGDHLKVVGFR